MGSKSTESIPHEVVFYTYPKYVFCWPLILIGLLLWPLTPDIRKVTSEPTEVAAADFPSLSDQSDPEAIAAEVAVTTDDGTESLDGTTEQQAAPATHGIQPTEVQAWIYGIVLVVVLVTLGFDLDRNQAFITVLLLCLGTFLVIILNMKGVGLFSHIYRFIVDLDLAYSRNFGLLVSLIMTVFWALMFLVTRLNSRWRVTHNEFEHYQFGRMDDSLARGAKRIKASYADLFEFLILAAGELIIYDASGNRELRRIPHVPMLPWIYKKINKILEVTAVTQGVLEDEGRSYDTEERNI